MSLVTQNPSQVILSKAELENYSLTPDSANTAGELLSAIAQWLANNPQDGVEALLQYDGEFFDFSQNEKYDRALWVARIYQSLQQQLDPDEVLH